MGNAFLVRRGGIFGGGSGKDEEEKNVSLNFSGGDQVVLPTEGKTISKVLIQKPETLISDNVKKGIVIAGIIGDYESVGIDLPKLNKPAISRSEDLLKITNPSTNGNFTDGYKIYSNGNLIATTSIISQYELINFPVGENSIQVKTRAENFNDSDFSTSILVNIYSISYDLTNLTANISESKIADGLDFTFKLTPVEGKYLPEFISITMDGIEAPFSYNSYSGFVSINNIQGNIVITAAAYDQPKLRTPEIVLEKDEKTLDITDIKFAQQILIFDNDIQVASLEAPMSYDVQNVEGVTYGFELNAEDYYESTNQNKANSYSLCKILFNAPKDTNIRLDCINSGESSYDYGILSKIDKELSKSITAETSTDIVQKNFKGLSSTSVQAVEYTVPQGEHFIMAKYRKDGSTNSGNDSFQFKIIILE